MVLRPLNLDLHIGGLFVQEGVEAEPELELSPLALRANESLAFQFWTLRAQLKGF
jgi:hypothetical protein